MPTLQELGDIFRKSLWEVLTGSATGGEKLPEQTFMTWCSPGLPYSPNDFDFAASGLFSPDPAIAAQKAQHAFNFASQVDLIPDPKGIYRGSAKEGPYMTTGDRLSVMYQQILQSSKVVNYPLTEHQQKQVDEARAKLLTVAAVTDPDTGKTEEMVKDTIMVREANAAFAKYREAARQYNAAAMAAGAAAGPTAAADIAYFQANGYLLRQQMNEAYNIYAGERWGNEIANARATIRQITEGGMVGWKNTLLNQMLTPISVPGGGAQYYYTTVVPGGFAEATGWTTLRHTHEQVNTNWSRTSTDWSAGAKIGWGLWSAGPDVTGSYQESDSNTQINNFTMQYAVTQVTIVRPWFYPEWFTNRGWKLEAGHGWNFDEMPSNGGAPPSGILVGYPVQMVLVKDVKIFSREFAQLVTEHAKQFDASLSFGWGPIVLKGKAGHSDSGGTFESTVDESSVTVPGMQVVLFINHLFGKAPDPDPNIPADAWLGV